MGFSTVGASVIVFIGFLIAITMVTNAYFTAEREVRDAAEDDQRRAEFDRATAFVLDSSDYQGNRLHLYYTNTGGSVLELARTHVVVDGVWVNDLIDQRDVGGDATATLWPPGTQLHLRIDIQPQPARAWFVTESGRGIIATV